MTESIWAEQTLSLAQSSSHTDASRRSASQEDRQPGVRNVNVEEVEVENSSEATEDPSVLSADGVVVGVVVSADDPAPVTRVVANNCPQAETVPLEAAADADPPSTDDPSLENKGTMSTRSATSSSCDPTASETRNKPQGGRSVDEALAVDQTTGEEKPEGGGGGGGGGAGGGAGRGVEIPASPAQDTPVPQSPAPPGLQHMRTQVSLEVVQCHSVACSPMTPPGGDHAFVFPVGAQTNDGEMQAGHRVEFRSVATAPMTPRTPVASTFPDIVKGESGRVEGEVRIGDVGQQRGQTDRGQQDLCSGATGVPEVSECTPAAGDVSVERRIKPNALPEPPSTQIFNLQVTFEDHQPPCRPQTQRIGSMDQDITILVTQHDSVKESDEEEAEAPVSAVAGSKMVKTEEEDEHHWVSKADREAAEAGEEVAKELVESQVSTDNSHAEKKSDTECAPNKSIADLQQSKMQIEGPSIIFREKEHPVQNKKSKSMIGEIKEEACLSENLAKAITKEASSLRKPPVPSSPAPPGCHNIYTQVSLEVVQCQSAATSPMTPPEGDNAFVFPPSCGKSPAMGPQVEYRSIATAPMTPNTPMAPVGFPTIGVATCEEEKILEVNKDKGKGDTMTTVADVHEKGASSLENGTVEEGTEDGTTGEEARLNGMTAGEECAANSCKEGSEEKSEEPVQEVSWDEKGMTWEVYGAVVEVAVLGSAIQKHLEKQVKKQKQPSLPPPPPLSPSAVPLPCPSPSAITATNPTQGSSSKGRGAGKRGERGGKEGRRRRNPFRLLLQNMQQPHCCSRAHSAE